MATAGAKIFISYSHKDEDLKEQVRAAFRAYGETAEEQLAPWSDGDIRAGNNWLQDIEQAMNQARVALLLLSTDFKNSEFIKTQELRTLLQRRETEGLRVIPIVARPCSWKSWTSINQAQVKPKGGRPLSKMKKAEREEAINDLVQEVAKILSEENTLPPLPVDIKPALTELFQRTLCSQLEGTAQKDAVEWLIRLLQDNCYPDPQQLLKAARYVVEYRLLLAAEEPHCQIGPSGRPILPGDDRELAAILKKLKDVWPRPDFQPRLDLQPGPFLERTLDRAEDWFHYFQALRVGKGINMPPERIESLCSLNIEGGALAPQYLLAGLMSHFHDDWKPVIDCYNRAGNKASDRQRLATSQWICWLVWGPSIPLCSCKHWQPARAYQFGYGDENNSLPAYLPQVPDYMARLLREDEKSERRAIEMESFAGRLVWGPMAFAGGRGFAGAQGRLTKERVLEKGSNIHQTDGLLIKVEHARPREVHEPAYFTSYIWMMFWVSSPAGPGALPRRVDGRELPAPAADTQDNARTVARARLWEDLLPVFVHANMLDPVVLRVQKGMLIENVVHVLRQMWVADKAAPVHFHLVCTSDYAGCGCEIEYPPPAQESLVELLQQRLAAVRTTEPELVEAIHVPAAGPDIPPAFRAFFSACHLPEMMEGYYEFLDKQLGH